MTTVSAQPPMYFPPAGGRYEVKPGLVRFGRDLGAGEADRHVFQIDSTFGRYRQAKLAARAERLEKYFQVREFPPHAERAVSAFILKRLVGEHPELFTLAGGTLSCELTGDRLHVDEHCDLVPAENPAAVAPPYRSTFDALSSQVQEDLAVVCSDGARHWLAAVHLSFPNHWAAEDKIGKAFPDVHQPVAGMEAMNRRAGDLVDVMLNARDGLVRFAWGITFDDELNHHPEPPPGERRSAAFDPPNPRAFLRVERQTVWGFPDAGAALFTIRTYLYDVGKLREDPGRRRSLAAAVASMTPASLAYKGLASSRDALLRWLADVDG